VRITERINAEYEAKKRSHRHPRSDPETSKGTECRFNRPLFSEMSTKSLASKKIDRLPDLEQASASSRLRDAGDLSGMASHRANSNFRSLVKADETFCT
jgi:hypothetical protein